MGQETPLNRTKLDEICTTLSESCGCDISIFFDSGRIEASTLTHQVGLIHPNADEILSKKVGSADVSAKIAAQSEDKLEGTTLALEVNEKPIGGICVIAPLELAKQFAPLAKVSAKALMGTDLNYLQKALAYSEERFRDFAEIAFDWLWEMGPDLRFNYLSGRVEEILGIPPSEILGKTRQAAHPVEAKKNSPKWRHHLELLKTHQPFTDLQVLWQRPDGEYRTLSLSGKPRVNGTGNFLGFRGVGRDITEQMRAEQKFRSLVEGSIQGIYIHRQWQLLFMNKSFADILGYDSVAELMEIESIATLLPPHEKDRLLKIRKARERGDNIPSRHDAEYLQKNGKSVWLESINEVIDWQGLPAIQSTVIDITERKHAEDQMIGALRELKNVLDASSLVSIIATDPDGIITLFNTGAERMLGYSAAEVLGKQTPAIIHLDSEMIARGKSLSKEYGRTIEGFEVFVTKLSEGGHEEREWTYVKKDGHHIQVNLSSTAVRNEEGTITGYLGVAMDITNRKKQEGELRHLRNYLTNIIDSMPSALIGVDMNSHVTQWNTGAEQLSNLSAIDAIGKPLSKVFPRLAKDAQQINQSMTNHQKITDLKRLHHHNGQLRYEDVTIFPLVANGFEGAVIRVDDVTEQVHMEEMMIQSEKMLSVGGLAAGMAHEINNPLAGMMQTANVINNRLTDKSMPANIRAAKAAGTSIDSIQKYMENRNILNMINDISLSGKRAADIVENMLSFARKADISTSSRDLSELLDKTLELAATDYDLKRQYDFKMIQIVKQYDAQLPLVPCESAKIQQVLLNLFRNGAQAMQEANTETPTLTLVTRFERGHQRACIEIRDNGPGMSEATRKRVFEPFFTTKPVDVGTGLGLSVSYFIVTENHHGTMSVESSLGQGSCFAIRLPINKID